MGVVTPKRRQTHLCRIPGCSGAALLGDGRGREHWGVGGAANASSKRNDGARLGTRKDSDGVRICSVSERLGAGEQPSDGQASG